MRLDPAFAKSCAAAVAAAWLAILLLGFPAPREKRLYPWQRATPRLAVLGALAVGTLFAGIALWQHGRVPDLWEMEQPEWVAAFERPARTLSSGSAFVAIAVVLTAAATAIGARSRTAARGVLLFALVLLAGAVWPLFSIPRWCAHLLAPEDLPEPSPLAAYRPDCDPASWVDAWSRALHPLAPWGMFLALAGAGAGLVFFRRATARADAEGRASACAGIALAGLLAVCGATLEFEKHAAWRAHDGKGLAQNAAIRRIFGQGNNVTRLNATYPGQWVTLTDPNGRIHTLWFGHTWQPAVSRPLAPVLTWLVVGSGLAAVLFGEFHLRGRRLLRDPVTGEPRQETS